MSDLRVIIGRESSPDELAAVTESFRSDRLEIIVRPDLMRMSHDWQNLPMTVMVFAQALAPNVIWDIVKLAAKKIFLDQRLTNRPPAIVVKRKNYDVIITDKEVRIRSFEENLSFSSIDELALYEQKQNHAAQAGDKAS